MKKLVFVSNFLNHHQIPLSNEFYRRFKGSYCFIQMESMSQERKNMGWEIDKTKFPYLIEYYDDSEEAQNIIDTSEIVIFSGAVKVEFIQNRVKNNKIVFKYDERAFKKNDFMWLNPRVLYMMIKCHVLHNRRNVFFLCAGAYVKQDFDLFRCYQGRMYSWGYFPQFYDYGEFGPNKEWNLPLKILWSGRLIDWKHPEIPISVASALRDLGITFELTMIGNGKLSDWVDYLISKKKLTNCIKRIDCVKYEDMQNYMLKADIFLLSSDRNEGWGAVANEAMNHGCILIANERAGAIPWLIEDGINGFCYRKKSEIVGIIGKLIGLQKNEINQIRYNAYRKIKDEWNAQVAVDRFARLVECPDQYMSPSKGVCKRL